MHRTIPQNEIGQDFVVGDIHGQLALLEDSLAEAGFRRERDRLFSVGDLIDRGPDSVGCLALLDAPWFFAVRGNHEQMMIDWAMGVEGPAWRQSYGGWLDGIPTARIEGWVRQLRSLPIALTLTGKDWTAGICHAETSGTDWTAMTADPACATRMMWGRKVLRGEGESGPVRGVDVTIHGHTPLPQPRRVDNRWFIDTGAATGQPMTVRRIAELVEETRLAMAGTS